MQIGQCQEYRKMGYAGTVNPYLPVDLYPLPKPADLNGQSDWWEEIQQD